MTGTATAGHQGRRTLGLVLIAIGVVLTLDVVGILNIQGLGRWWPLSLIGIGLVKVRQPIEDGQRSVGTALLFVGGLLQLVSVLSLANGWPLIMIAVGGFLLWQGVAGPAVPVPPPAESPFVSEMALIAYVKRGLRTTQFRGGSITAVMGGVELDMRNVTMGPGPASLDVVAFWGGIELKVPVGWTVESEVLPMLGAFENKTQSPAESGASHRLVIRGYAIMSAVTIGN